MRVLYYAPDTHIPSWGVGMLYCHVRLLCAHGIDAYVLHEKRGFRPNWLDSDAPRLHRGSVRFRADRDDLMVVPEIFAGADDVLLYPCRRIVFVQASSFIAPGLHAGRGYRELGYYGAMAAMPHIQTIVERHYGVRAAIVPPCVAPYFFLGSGQFERPRKRQVALIPKEWCRDYSIAQQMLRDHSKELGWRVVELGQKSHRQVARALRQAAFHVNVNCHESFNATVPEAMAAGCLPICYEAFGGRDYLRDGENAFVFPTHDAYGLIERTLDLMKSYDRLERRLGKMRRAAMATALEFTERHTESALLEYFEPLISGSGRRERK